MTNQTLAWGRQEMEDVLYLRRNKQPVAFLQCLIYWDLLRWHEMNRMDIDLSVTQPVSVDL